MRLCMFHPNDTPLERGWVGRVDGDRVVHLAAQTLQHFFTGGASAREHAEYPLDDVTFLAPVLHPPAVRVFAHEERFVFGNPAAVVGPNAPVPRRTSHLSARGGLAAVVGGEGAIGGFTGCVQWHAPGLPSPKDADFGIPIGPVVVTPDELMPAGLEASLGASLDWSGHARVNGVVPSFDWQQAAAFAAAGTVLRPGDLLLGPPAVVLDGVTDGGVTLQIDGFGSLDCPLAP